MCYMIITSRSLLWFVVSLFTTMLISYSMTQPSWVVSQKEILIHSANLTIRRHPSVGIYTRCKMMGNSGYHCGNFDLDGFMTDSSIYPIEWKLGMFFIATGFTVSSCAVVLSVLSGCRQSVFGKSIHSVTGSCQVFAGILVLFCLFLHPLGWGSERVVTLCGPDAEAFYYSDCQIGLAMYSAILSVFLCFFCAYLSLLAESGNLRSVVKRRVEQGEKLVCVP